VLASTSNGYFLDTCVVHTQSCSPSWYGITVEAADNATMATAFGNWYFGRDGPSRVLDGSPNEWYGHGNPTCGVSTGGWC
jgi:hypothetical protein